MEFESMKQMLQAHTMEEVQAPQSKDIFNIFCQKDGEYINTVQVIAAGDEAPPFISAKARRLLELAITNHGLQHQPNYQVSIYEGVSEPVLKKQ